jgi:hypothetical protein
MRAPPPPPQVREPLVLRRPHRLRARRRRVQRLRLADVGLRGAPDELPGHVLLRDVRRARRVHGGCYEQAILYRGCVW